MALHSTETGGDAWYIVVAKDSVDEGVAVGQPIRADSPTDAVSKRGMLGYEKIRVYECKAKPTASCEFWDQDDLEA